MSSNSLPAIVPTESPPPRPFRRAVLRGLAMLLPPLLTVVVLLWAWNVIRVYALIPVETGARHLIVWSVRDVLNDVPPSARHYVQPQETTSTQPDMISYQGQVYVSIPQPGNQTQWIPQEVYKFVQQRPGDKPLVNADAYYHRYVDLLWLPQYIVVPIFLVIFILLLYVAGKLVTAPLGTLLWSVVEALIHRLPLVRKVYSSVKQVTDFMISEQEIRFNRVVAIEYPRKGIWSIGFVTGDGLRDVSDSAGQPVVSVLVPTSPMPATGFTVLVLKSEVVDLDLTLDQAIQYIVSCGVVVAPHQLTSRNAVEAKVAAAVSKGSIQSK
jgi:uncharacterized membrane protein